MTTLRDKAKGINQEAFQDGESLGIMASYLHEDVKEAVLTIKKYWAGLYGSDDVSNIIWNNTWNKIHKIFGDFK